MKKLILILIAIQITPMIAATLSSRAQQQVAYYRMKPSEQRILIDSSEQQRNGKFFSSSGRKALWAPAYMGSSFRGEGPAAKRYAKKVSNFKIRSRTLRS